MVSLIMSSSSVHHAMTKEINRKMMGYIIPIGWWMLIVMVVTLVVIYVWHWVNLKRQLSEPMGPEPLEPVGLEPVGSESVNYVGPDILVRVEVGEVNDPWSDF